MIVKIVKNEGEQLLESESLFVKRNEKEAPPFAVHNMDEATPQKEAALITGLTNDVRDFCIFTNARCYIINAEGKTVDTVN